RGFAVVNVADGADVDVRFIAFELGLRHIAAIPMQGGRRKKRTARFNTMAHLSFTPRLFKAL
ncbi:hypothetical protein, partial [Falsigemmobacter intermedius]|uniref:hypothetical protein n=1 Tax=Falsigemmobacter intermedius TaxID=1553448 RepID=UPI003F053B55